MEEKIKDFGPQSQHKNNNKIYIKAKCILPGRGYFSPFGFPMYFKIVIDLRAIDFIFFQRVQNSIPMFSMDTSI